MGGDSTTSVDMLHYEIEDKQRPSKQLLDVSYEGKGDLPDHQVIFSLSNAITGPNLILLPLLFYQTGLLASVLLGIFFGYVAYKTCYLTVMHVKPTEPEYLFTIQRVLGKPYMLVYLIIVILDLWLVAIIFYVSLVDTLYSAIQGFAHVPAPSDTLIFHEFSIQWLAVIVAVLLLICVSFKDISKIVSLSSKGEIGIILAAFFLVYIGLKAIIKGEVNITFGTDESMASVPMFSYDSLFTLIGFYSAAYLLHFMSVPILRTGKDATKKPRNLFLSYIMTGGIYLVTGVFGALGLYWRISPTDAPQTIFGAWFDSSEKDVFVLSIITQIAVAFQLLTVIPVINFITRNQIFSEIWKKEEGKTVPDWAFHGYNVLMVIVVLGCMILNLSPTNLMNYVGTFGGFIIVYSVPVLLHLKSQRTYLETPYAYSNAGVPVLEDDRKLSVASEVHKSEAHISPIRLNIFYIGVLLLGVGLVVVNICIAAGVPAFSG